MSKSKKIATEWIYPAVWGIMMYNVLRAVTDLTHHGIFWEGEIKLHITALLLSVLVCYLFNYGWKQRLLKAGEGTRIGKDYAFVVLELIVWLNLLLKAGQELGVLFMGSGWIDYMLINVIYVPLLLIFYTLIRGYLAEQKANEKHLALEKLKTDKKEAELEFLKSQYHPHFLFNALNTIYFQVDENNAEAKKSIEYLSELLRYQLYDVNQEVAFYQEINYLRSYIAFQQLRKTDKLKVNIDIDNRLKEQRIAPLLLQPLLENAFKYVSGGYEITLVLKLKEDQVYFELTNSVSDVLVSSNVQDSGIGLSNLKRRLELLYPEKHQMTVNNGDNFFKVILTLPVKE
ncbi:sensor histidine kinase [Flavobacterium phragmitis]|uniref:Histidine kinase n=1 Tax=Flavobacterium phragmitis TaxID=739143 RepID=A0A1I1XLR1_9FLAO|nr:histidine kinase [Flavobacterium phragmitis]SFE08242.1 Histidine kinase [Flavobacterium phragmitis]